jgi:hypothetical protein
MAAQSGLRFAWECCGHVVMNISDLPTTVLVRHDVSRFMLRFLRLSLQALDGNARVRHRFRSYGAGLMLNRAPAATRPVGSAGGVFVVGGRR